MTSPTAGYQVGNAFIQMLPSFRAFHQRIAAEMARVGDVHVDVEPEVSPRKLAAVATAMDDRLAKTPIVKRVEVDERAFKAQMALLTSRRDAVKLRIDADISAALAKIADLERKRGTVTINVDAEIAKARAKIKSLEAERDTVDIQLDVDTGKAERKLNQVEQHLNRIKNNQTDINMEASDASRVVAVLGLVTAGLAVVGQLAPAAAAALAAIPGALAGAAQGIGAAVAGFSGISDTVKAFQGLEDAAASTSSDNAQKRVSAAGRVASAQSSLQRALEQADRASIDGAHQVSEAREALADAQVNAASRVQDAERALTTAQQSSRDAQEALTRARKDAIESLEDLRLALSGAALDEEGAVLAVERAQNRLTAAQAAGVSGLALAEISLSARQAVQSLAEVRERYGDLQLESEEASRAGVDGSREVVSAQRDAEQATLHVKDAERGLALAREDGAKQVAKAQERVAQAQQQASQAATDASRAVADAQRSLAEASVSAGDSGSAAIDKLSLAMSKLSPAGQAFAQFLQNRVKPAIHDVAMAVQGSMLPRIQVAMDTLLALAPIVQESFAQTGKVIGDLAMKGADMVTQGPWRADFATIMARNNRVIGDMGNAGLSALDVIRNLTIASGPLLEALTASTAGYAAQFQAWIQGKRDSGELETWFQEMSVRIREAFVSFGQLTGGVFDVLQALAPLGRVILQIVAPLVQMIGAMLEANPALSTMLALAILGTSSFVSFFRTVGGLTQAFRTSSGVYNSFKDAFLGVKTATEGATAAATQNADATTNVGTKLAQAGGVVGQFRGGLDSVKDAYAHGATSARTWATNTSTAVGRVASDLSNKLVPAVSYGLDGLNKYQPATSRASESVRSFSSVATSGLSQVSRVSVLGAESLRSWTPAAGSASGSIRTMTTAASTAFSGVASTVGGTVAAVGKGISGMASGLVGALGGPFGIAIAAATIGLGFLISAQADAAKAAAEHEAKVKGLTDALVESGGAIDDNIRKKISMDLMDRSIADNARNFGLNVGQMIDAISKGGDAAKNFEGDLKGVGEQLVTSNSLTREQADALKYVTKQLSETGGKAADYSAYIDQIVADWQVSHDASDEATKAFQDQLTQFLDLVGGYRSSKGDFKEASQGQKDIAAAQEDAAGSTARHTQALKALQDQIIGQIDKDLAYRQSLQSLAEAQDRVATSSGSDLPAALLAEEQALISVIQKAGDLAYANSTAANETGRLRDQQVAQIASAVELAGQYSGPLPTALQTYLEKLITTKDQTGQYQFLLDKIPPEILTKVFFDDKDARQGIIALTTFMANQTAVVISGFAASITRGLSGGKARGGIDIPAYALGGVRPMSSKVANIVPPRQPRLIGDRMQGPEAFIPLNRDPRSVAILAQAAAAMGFTLLPLALGGLLAMADGGVNQAAPAAAAGGTAALTVDAVPVDALTAAVQQLVTLGLAPLATEVTTSTTPALMLLEQHAGTQAVAAVTALAALLGPLRDQFTLTAAVIGAAWLATTQASLGGVSAIGGYLATLRLGVQQTGAVFASTADWVGTTWARIRPYTADPVRAALAGPYNAGLIPAWNYINSFFALNRPLAPLAIPFAIGGEVPGVGSGDTVPALLTPGEYVISRPVVKKWGLSNINAAHMAARRGGFPGLEGMLSGDDRGIFRVGFASGGPVPEALARATQFGRSMHGKPYIWGGSSEAGTDCSGWMSMLARALVDERPYARREWATAVAGGGNPPPRFARGIGGTFAIGVKPGVHTAGTLAGTNAESGGAHNYVAFGPPSTGADDSQFPMKFHLAELGGNFVSGGAAGSFDLGAFVRDSFNATHEQLAAYQNAWGANMMAQAGAAVVGQAADAAVNWAVSNISPMGTTGNVESWRPLVLQALRMLSLPQDWADVTLRRMNQESGGNPRAVNLWDSNAKNGIPSKGLMQVIDPTFRAYRDTRAPDDIWDPLANVLASMKYATSRYGSLPAGYGRAGGYDSGGYLPPGYSTVHNGLSRPEVVLTDNQWSTMFNLAAQDSATGDFSGNLYLSSGEFLGAVEGVIERANTESGRVLARRTR